MNRKQKYFMIVILTSLLAAIILPMGIQNAYAFTDLARVSPGERLPRFIDDVGILSSTQAEALTEKLDSVSLQHQFDTVIAVVSSLDGWDAYDYASDFFEQNGFGLGDDYSGAILLLAIESRDFAFVTFESGVDAFTPAGQEYLDKLFLPHLKKDNYYKAFMAFGDAVDDFMARAASGRPYDVGNIPKTPEENIKYRLIGAIGALVLALIIAWSVTFSWKRQLVSVRQANYASEYIRQNSMALNISRDIFLHRQVRKIRRSTESSGSSGVRKSISSSGRRTSGHSGKF
ncbi:MAG: hypothetical protein GX144_13820 [Clostridiaceae bacterium]|jgi:uncharacterized protein|nr:hypothetical protein [Clostridiaceae bacterium]